jgi:hypothetical protein
MNRPRRDSRQCNGITLKAMPQATFATKSARSGHEAGRLDYSGKPALRKPSSSLA